MSDEIERRSGIRLTSQISIGNWITIITILGGLAGGQWSIAQYEAKRDARQEDMQRQITAGIDNLTVQLKDAKKDQAEQFRVLQSATLPIPTLSAQQVAETKRLDDTNMRLEALSRRLEDMQVNVAGIVARRGK